LASLLTFGLRWRFGLPPRSWSHVPWAAYLTTSFVVLAVGARYIFAGKHLEHGGGKT
jgi:hypothetical protein